MQATFVTTHFVSAEYHKNHPQLVHKHADELELLYFTQGEGPYIVEGKEYYVTPGSLMICNAGLMHGEAPTQQLEKESICCVLRDVQVDGLPDNTITKRGVNPLVVFPERRRETVTHIYRALHEVTAQEMDPAIAQSLAEAILRLVLEELERRQTAVLSEDDRSEEEFVRTIADYLDEHFADDISMGELSERFHISPYYLSRFFKKGTGIPPMKYIMNRRIGEAQSLLMNTDEPIGDIGHRIGIPDIAFFSKQFKKYVGVTPSAFRAFHKEHDRT